MLDFPTLTLDQYVNLTVDQYANLILVDGMDSTGAATMAFAYYRRRRRLRGGDG